MLINEDSKHCKIIKISRDWLGFSQTLTSDNSQVTLSKSESYSKVDASNLSASVLFSKGIFPDYWIQRTWSCLKNVPASSARYVWVLNIYSSFVEFVASASIILLDRWGQKDKQVGWTEEPEMMVQALSDRDLIHQLWLHNPCQHSADNIRHTCLIVLSS